MRADAGRRPRVVDRVLDLSRLIHDAIYRDASQSLCARAWARRDTSLFWSLWVITFGPRHCEASWRWYHD